MELKTVYNSLSMHIIKTHFTLLFAIKTYILNKIHIIAIRF